MLVSKTKQLHARRKCCANQCYSQDSHNYAYLARFPPPPKLSFPWPRFPMSKNSLKFIFFFWPAFRFGLLVALLLCLLSCLPCREVVREGRVMVMEAEGL